MSYNANNLENDLEIYRSYKNSLAVAQDALNKVISQGTILYQNADFATLFPVSWAAYQAYLLSAGNKINTFIAGFPAEPPLSG